MVNEEPLSGSHQRDIDIYTVSSDHHDDTIGNTISPTDIFTEFTLQQGDELHKHTCTDDNKDKLSTTLEIAEGNSNLEQKREWTILETLKMWKEWELVERLTEVGLWGDDNGGGYCLMFMLSTFIIVMVLLFAIG